MLEVNEKKQLLYFESIYDKYSPLLNGILSKISKDGEQNEEILIETFVTYFELKKIQEESNLIFIELLKTSLFIFSKKNNLSRHNMGVILKNLNIKNLVANAS